MNFNRHYKFKTRLQERRKAMKTTRLHIVNEAYTSKTCTKCGCIKQNLGSNAASPQYINATTVGATRNMISWVQKMYS